MKKTLAILLLALLCVTAFAEADKPMPDPNAGEYRSQYPTAPNVMLPGWKEIHIEADTVRVWMPFFNPEANEGLYDLTFSLWAALPEDAIGEGIETELVEETDRETGETTQVLYAKLSQSGLVAPGLYLQDVTLFQPVPKGIYKAQVRMQPYHKEDTTPTQTSGTMVILLNAG